MANIYQNQYPNMQLPYQQYNQNQMFSQPQLLSPTGNVYVTNTMQEANNVPVGIGTTVALCLPEKLMFIKTAQNGIPIVKQYSLEEVVPKSPATMEEENSKLSKENEKLKTSLEELQEKVRMIEAQYKDMKASKTSEGGTQSWQL